MPIRASFLERAAFFTLNAAPAPMLDLGGAIAYQTISIAVRLGVFGALADRPSTSNELADTLQTHPRGTRRLLLALQAIGYVAESNGRFRNTPMTEKWFLDGDMLDMNAAVTTWDAFLRALWPHGPEIVRTGERPFDFYEFTAAEPGLSHAHQQMMMGNANAVGADIVKRIAVPASATHLLDVGGGHGAFSILFGLMYFLFADGRTFTRDELTSILQDAGFGSVSFHPLRQAPGSSLLVAR